MSRIPALRDCSAWEQLLLLAPASVNRAEINGNRGAMVSATGKALERGAILASMLAGSWRTAVAQRPLDRDALAAVLPDALGGGAAGLVLRSLSLPGLAASQRLALQRAHRHALAHADSRQENLQWLVWELCRAALPHLVLKGWAVARLYADPALRPFDDFDICVPAAALPA